METESTIQTLDPLLDKTPKNDAAFETSPGLCESRHMKPMEIGGESTIFQFARPRAAPHGKVRHLVTVRIVGEKVVNREHDRQTVVFVVDAPDFESLHLQMSQTSILRESSKIRRKMLQNNIICYQ
jgi:hypothetical protein